MVFSAHDELYKDHACMIFLVLFFTCVLDTQRQRLIECGLISQTLGEFPELAILKKSVVLYTTLYIFRSVKTKFFIVQQSLETDIEKINKVQLSQ
mgnify:CR=1 FL=1